MGYKPGRPIATLSKNTDSQADLDSQDGSRSGILCIFAGTYLCPFTVEAHRHRSEASIDTISDKEDLDNLNSWLHQASDGKGHGISGTLLS